MRWRPQRQPAATEQLQQRDRGGPTTRTARSEPEVVRIELFGGFRFWVGPRLIEEDRWRLRKAKSLVKLLALASGHRLHREQVLEALWPDLGMQEASNNLHQILHAVRRALEPSAPASSSAVASSGYLLLRDEQLTLCPDSPLWVDVEAFEEAATAARHAPVEPAAFRAAIDLYAGELLPEDRYEPWVEQRRAQLRELYLSLLLELAVSKFVRMVAAGSAVVSLLLGAQPSARRRRFAPMVLVSLLGGLLALGCAPERPPGPPSGKLIVAAGDIASCASEGDEATARLVGRIEGTVLTLGDNAYPDGTAQDFEECYEPTWGQFKERTRPAPGNHEYETGGSLAYFDYFGDAAGDPDKGYYSYELGSWHMVVLNSNCGVGEIRCGFGSPQGRWLQEDLTANDEQACTLAYFHHPLFTSGSYRPGIKRVERLWEILYAAGVDVVLNGHDHNYQRFAPQDPGGRADPEDGIRQFVVGTGGRSHYQISHPIANTEVYNDDAYGVLKLTLHPKRYDWEFVPVEGEIYSDSGVARCH